MMMLRRLKTITSAFAVLLVPLGAIWLSVGTTPRVQFSVDDRLIEFGASARNRMLPHFLRAGVPYPPARLVLLGLKEERQIQIYAPDHGGTLRFVRSMRVIAAAGGPGPKLREGDRQVPEGVYPIRYLNPNSAAYVSLMIGYPNAFDKARALKDGRKRLGGDIVIHGPTAGTAGCLALSEDSVEEVFTLVADTGVGRTRMILAPHDLRRRKPPPAVAGSEWTNALYARLSGDLAKLPAPAYMPRAER